MTSLDTYRGRKTAEKATRTDSRSVSTLQRCSVAPLLIAAQTNPESFLTLVRLKVRPGSFDLAQRAGAGLQDENGGSEGPRQLCAMARRGATFRLTQATVSSWDADAWRWAAWPDIASIDTCCSLSSRHLVPSSPVQWRGISVERERMAGIYDSAMITGRGYGKRDGPRRSVKKKG